MKTYRLQDNPTAEEKARHGLGPKASRLDVLAVRTGEMRRPRQGEWYLSGAVPEAYRAPNDLGTAYHILRLVRRGERFAVAE